MSIDELVALRNRLYRDYLAVEWAIRQQSSGTGSDDLSTIEAQQILGGSIETFIITIVERLLLEDPTFMDRVLTRRAAKKE